MKKQDIKAGKTSNNNGEGTTPVPRYKIHLRNPEDVRRLLSATINELRAGKLDGARAGKIIYAASVLLNVFDQCHLAERIKKLEEMTKEER